MATSHGRLSAFVLGRTALRAAAGDGRAFRSLFGALHPPVYRYLAARAASRADAEDLTASVFARIVERLPTYDPQRGSPRAWALTMARSALIDHLRACRRDLPLGDSEDLVADANSGLEPVEDARIELVRRALLNYPPLVRELFALRYGDGLRTKEIAVVMSMSETAVKQRFSRILRELRKRAQNGELGEEMVHAH